MPVRCNGLVKPLQRQRDLRVREDQDERGEHARSRSSLRGGLSKPSPYPCNTPPSEIDQPANGCPADHGPANGPPPLVAEIILILACGAYVCLPCEQESLKCPACTICFWILLWHEADGQFAPYLAFGRCKFPEDVGIWMGPQDSSDQGAWQQQQHRYYRPDPLPTVQAMHGIFVRPSSWLAANLTLDGESEVIQEPQEPPSEPGSRSVFLSGARCGDLRSSCSARCTDSNPEDGPS